MNIFYLSRDVEECARFHCDKHVNKMILEGAQLLASAIWVTDPKLAESIPGIYRLTHKNHPSAVWVRSNFNHYAYLLGLMDALNTEAQYRYNRTNSHLSLDKALDWPCPPLPCLPFTEPPKCVHDDFKGIPDTVEAYREYYKRDKRDIAAWTKRDVPYWF
jgi:hypothetical protein